MSGVEQKVTVKSEEDAQTEAFETRFRKPPGHPESTGRVEETKVKASEVMGFKKEDIAVKDEPETDAQAAKENNTMTGDPLADVKSVKVKQESITVSLKSVEKKADAVDMKSAERDPGVVVKMEEVKVYIRRIKKNPMKGTAMRKGNEVDSLPEQKHEPSEEERSNKKGNEVDSLPEQKHEPSEKERSNKKGNEVDSLPEQKHEPSEEERSNKKGNEVVSLPEQKHKPSEKERSNKKGKKVDNLVRQKHDPQDNKRSYKKGKEVYDLVRQKHDPEEERSKKQGKKIYDLPGQKHDPPEERDPLRIFYDSLYKENPKSEMAEIWMMEYGLLPLHAAKSAFQRKQKRQPNWKTVATPVKLVKDGDEQYGKKSLSANGINKASSMKKQKQEVSDDELILQPKKKLKMSS